MAAGLPLPDKGVRARLAAGRRRKMSKSKLTGISPESITDDFGADAFRLLPARHPVRAGRLVLLEDMAARYQAELANGLGNLASRATAMVVRYRDGSLPAPGD